MNIETMLNPFHIFTQIKKGKQIRHVKCLYSLIFKNIISNGFTYILNPFFLIHR